MKKNIFFIFVILSCLIFNQFVSSETNQDQITGDITVDATGEVTSQQVTMSIFVQTTVPYIQINSPKNQTYLKNESLILDYTMSNGNYIRYNIDNSENITIDSSTLFNVSQGFHTLYIFTNNNNATATSSVSFTVNSSKFVILFEAYNGTNKGTSTNFIDYTYEEIQDLNGIILENTNYGKIIFNEVINISNDRIYADNLLNLGLNINISFNSIEINSTEIPNFDKPATLWLYNLNFTNPRILKDGIVCLSAICTKESYTSPSIERGDGILKFNVTGFSVYSAEETPLGESSIPPSSGGVSTQVSKYIVNSEEILVYLKQGENTSKYFTIENKDNKNIDLTIESQNMRNLIVINETKISLKPGESKQIRIDFLAKEDTIPNLYLGKILITAKDTQKEILVAVEVESKVSLFDVKIKIPNEYKYVLPGEDVSAQIELYNVGSNKKIDVSLDYIIKNDKGNEIVKEHETIAVGTSASFSKKIQIPENIAFGKYVFYVKLNYEDKTASASSWFNVEKIESDKLKMFLYILVIILIIIILMLIYEIRKIKKYLKPIYKVDESLLAKKEFILEDDDE